MSKTINQALKDLFIGLGGDPSALADNDTVSDYIADLESAIKASGGSTYSKTVLHEGGALETITLSESYKNFDALVLVVADINPDTGDPCYIYSPYIPTDSDIGAHYKIPYAVINSNMYYSEFTILSNTSIYWTPATDEKLYKVIGIKF